jgi:SAM-dependent methyltransferase
MPRQSWASGSISMLGRFRAVPHDWERIAEKEAFFGVFTAERFRTARLTPEHIAEFYHTGENNISYVLDCFRRVFADAPDRGVAIDIGCGVGRLARAMRAHAERVIGYDVSGTMVALARIHAGEGVEYVTELPAGPFHWINSYIVLQHIPPVDGLALLRRAMSGLGPRGFVSIHVTAWRDPGLQSSGMVNLLRGLFARALARAGRRPLDALIQMHDYALTDVVRLLVEAGVGELHLLHVNHGGHHGVWICGRRG